MAPEKQEVLWEKLVELKETPGQGGETPEKRGEPKKACAIPEAADAALQEQEVVQIPLWEMKPSASEAVSSSTPSICLEMQGIRIEIHEQAGADVIKHTLLALRQLC